jgi:hypothetical protein
MAKKIAAIATTMRPNKIIHFDCRGEEPRLCSPARAHARGERQIS